MKHKNGLLTLYECPCLLLKVKHLCVCQLWQWAGRRQHWLAALDRGSTSPGHQQYYQQTVAARDWRCSDNNSKRQNTVAKLLYQRLNNCPNYTFLLKNFPSWQSNSDADVIKIWKKKKIIPKKITFRSNSTNILSKTQRYSVQLLGEKNTWTYPYWEVKNRHFTFFSTL